MTIITYNIEPRCKHCRWCGYVRPMTKEGRPSWRTEYYCANGHEDWIGAKRVSLRDHACRNFEMSMNGFVSAFEHIDHTVQIKIE